MDRTISPLRSSILDSSSSDDSDLSTSPPPTSSYPPYLLPYIHLVPPDQKKKPTARRLAKRLARLEARLGPVEIIARAQRRIEREKFKKRETALLKKACIKRELKRAMKTARLPITFQTIDIHNDGDEEDSAYEQGVTTQDDEIGAETEATKAEAFAGLVIIQDRLSAMNQALADHDEHRTRRKVPGRLSFHVDASVSRYGTTGIAVVHKKHRQDWASLWTAKGYRILETLDSRDAEA